MNLSVEQTPYMWSGKNEFTAVDMDSYDGAPDSTSDITGYGFSKIEAVQHLFEHLEEAEFYTVEYLQQELAVYKLKGTV